MFWSLVLEPGKRYSSTVKESFHLSMATLDIKSCKNDSEIYPVLIEVEGTELILCNLSKSSSPHANLDLVFQRGTEITFSTNGKAIIHLTGYCIQDGFSDMDDDDSSLEEEEEDESFNDLVKNAKNASGQLKLESKSKNIDNKNANKRKLDPVEATLRKRPKSGKVEESDDEDESDSDDSSVDLDDSKLDQLMDSVNTEGDSSDEDDSDLDDEDDDVDDSEGEDEVDDEEDDEEDEDDDDDDDDSEDEKPKLKPSIKQEIKTPLSNKQKTPISNKKQDKQNKNQLTNGVTPQSNKKDKNKNQTNQPTPKQDGQKTPNKDAQKTPKKGEPSPQAQKKQTLSGGVVVEDLKPGNGPPAKYGKMVQVYYTGRLKNNNRVFDKTTEGSGFKFRLGNNEVIKGWDVALNGMKVGAKRRITIPPGMAYGNKGSPPAIPPNSWLIFDVEMKAVN